jgi:hypothetical protein
VTEVPDLAMFDGVSRNDLARVYAPDPIPRAAVVPAVVRTTSPAPSGAVSTAPRRQVASRAPVKKRSWQDRALVIGGSAGAGAGIGALIGGKKGALIGAAIGGGSGTVYEVVKH